jgi:hypothetical protein
MRTEPYEIDRETSSLAGVPDSLSAAPPEGTAKILIFPTQTAANYGFWGDAGEPMDLDDDVYPIGFLAVKLVGQFDRPRIHCEMVAADLEGGEPDRLP